MKYKTTAYIYISISGEFNELMDFIDYFNISPTKQGKNIQNEYYVEYKIVARDADVGLDLAIEEMIKLFQPKSKEIKAYTNKNKLYAKIFVVFQNHKNENNGVFFNADFINFVNELGAEIEIDFYN